MIIFAAQTRRPGRRDQGNGQGAARQPLRRAAVLRQYRADRLSHHLTHPGGAAHLRHRPFLSLVVEGREIACRRAGMHRRCVAGPDERCESGGKSTPAHTTRRLHGSNGE